MGGGMKHVCILTATLARLREAGQPYLRASRIVWHSIKCRPTTGSYPAKVSGGLEVA